MKRSAQKSYFKLFNSLSKKQREDTFFICLPSLFNKSMVAKGLVRILATALAMLMLFSTIAGPLSSFIWSYAADATDPDDNELSQNLAAQYPPRMRM
ncbi:MAG: hypothetical protein FWD44_03195 [Oscillospiraceae bacterium]|nr:hypothetical protein [Oscillospiraceae bacterium]